MRRIPGPRGPRGPAGPGGNAGSVLIATFGQRTGIGGGDFFGPFANDATANESECQTILPIDYRLDFIVFLNDHLGGANNTTTCTARIGGVNTSLTATLGAGENVAITPAVVDTNANDLLSVQLNVLNASDNLTVAIYGRPR